MSHSVRIANIIVEWMSYVCDLNQKTIDINAELIVNSILGAKMSTSAN